jgi:hypothetical protein
VAKNYVNLSLTEDEGELLFLFDTKNSQRRIILSGEMHGLS